MRITLGGGRLDRQIDEAEGFLAAYRSDDGLRYLDYQPVSYPDVLVPDDLAVTILINSRVGPAAFKSAQDHGHELALSKLPPTSLEETGDAERQAVAEVVAQMASWPGFAASVAPRSSARRAVTPPST
jgi:hypothetical protein